MDDSETTVIELEISSNEPIRLLVEPIMEKDQEGNQDSSAQIEMEDSYDTNLSKKSQQPGTLASEEESGGCQDIQRALSDSSSDSDDHGGTLSGSYDVNPIDLPAGLPYNTQESDENEKSMCSHNSGSNENVEGTESNIDNVYMHTGENTNCAEKEDKSGIPIIIIDLAEDVPPPLLESGTPDIDSSDTEPEGKHSLDNNADENSSPIVDENKNNTSRESDDINQNSQYLDNAESSACAWDSTKVCSDPVEDSVKDLASDEAAFTITMEEDPGRSDTGPVERGLPPVSLDISRGGHRESTEALLGTNNGADISGGTMECHEARDGMVVKDHGESSDSIVSTPDFSDSSNSSGYPAVVPSDLPRSLSERNQYIHVQSSSSREVIQLASYSQIPSGDISPNMAANVSYEKGTTGDDVIWADCYQVRRKEYVFVEDISPTDHTGAASMEHSHAKPEISSKEHMESPPAKRSKKRGKEVIPPVTLPPVTLQETCVVAAYNEAFGLAQAEGAVSAPAICSYVAPPEPPTQSTDPKAKERKKKGGKKDQKLPPAIPIPPEGSLVAGPPSPSHQPPSSPLVKLRRKKLSFRRKDKSQQDPTVRHSIGSPFSGFPLAR